MTSKKAHGRKPNSRIALAPQAWPFVLPALSLAALGIALQATVGGYWWILATVFGALGICCVFFFRDPQREGAAGDDVILAPADGKIIFVGEVDHERFPGGKAMKVGIFLSVLDVHVNRAPFAGKILTVEPKAGKFLNALSDESSLHNESNTIAADTIWGYTEIKQIAGLIARRIVCYVAPGDPIARGQRIGIIRFGSRTELFVPVGAQIWVKPGDRVRGAATPLGRMGVSVRRF